MEKEGVRFFYVRDGKPLKELGRVGADRELAEEGYDREMRELYFQAPFRLLLTPHTGSDGKKYFDNLWLVPENLIDPAQFAGTKF